MDLRDRFAAYFASTLVDAFDDAGQVARRAYDLADAMMLERAHRIDADEESAIAREQAYASISEAPEPPASYHGALLDEPEPMLEPDAGFDDDLAPHWLEPPYDPTWDLEAHWSMEPALRAPAEPSPRPISSRPPGPGLARTQPEPAVADEARKERSA